jgi:hypothetical protein
MNEVTVINPDLSNIEVVEDHANRIKIAALVTYFEGEEGKILLREFKAKRFNYLLATGKEFKLLDPAHEDNIVDAAINVITDEEISMYTLMQEPDADKTIRIFFLPHETTTETFRTFIDEYLSDDGLDDEDEVYTPPYMVEGKYLN